MHLGIIPDGNRRYAREKGISKDRAYRKSKDVILDLFDNVDDMPVDIDETTFYLLSEDNLRRDEEELETLFELLSEQIEETASHFNGKGFAFNWVSTRPEALPGYLRKKLSNLEEEYGSGKKQLNVLIAYSGRQDIVRAADRVCEESGEFSREAIRRNLGIQSDIDFVIRSGDNPTREAISDFPIWNASYAEYYHVKKYFPALETSDIEQALHHFRKLRRKKGQ
ncbi:MAG: undecaprenyl diphosphate synthase family protein [Candidatus Nanohaloarchaea archaeon]